MNPFELIRIASLPLTHNRRGQTALEYMLMIAVVLVLLILVLSMTQYVEQVGTGLGGRIDDTRAQVIDWILT
jgi:Flp pilus assembly pilin Flp